MDGIGNTSLYAALPGHMTSQQLAHKLLLDPIFQLYDESTLKVDSMSQPLGSHFPAL